MTMVAPQVLDALPSSSPTDVLGSAIIGGMGEMMLQGLLISQFLTFGEKPTKNRLVRYVVYWVNFVALMQTLITGHNWWHTFVNGFGTIKTLLGFTWSSEIQPILNACMSGPVQSYFVYRCWILTHRNWSLTILLYCGVALSVITACLTSTDTILLSANGFFPTETVIMLWPTYFVWLISTAVLDVIITAILLNYLIRSRQQTRSRYLTSLIDRLITLVWQSAAPPCICAVIIATISGIVSLQGTVSYWTFVPNELLGKLYCISLMNTVNSRDSLAQQVEVTDPHAPTTIPGVAFDLQTLQKPPLTDCSTMHTMEDIPAVNSYSSSPIPVSTDAEG